MPKDQDRKVSHSFDSLKRFNFFWSYIHARNSIRLKEPNTNGKRITFTSALRDKSKKSTWKIPTKHLHTTFTYHIDLTREDPLSNFHSTRNTLFVQPTNEIGRTTIWCDIVISSAEKYEINHRYYPFWKRQKISCAKLVITCNAAPMLGVTGWQHCKS